MDRADLAELYIAKRMSAREVSNILNCSENKVNYWIRKFNIPKRTISDAMVAKNHKNRDDYSIKRLNTHSDYKLYGLGVGLYWGEGNKKNLHTVRLGNTDPEIIKTFVAFLVEICGVNFCSIRYGLQVFSDVSAEEARIYWQNELEIEKSQIMPTISRINSGKIGTYKTKNRFGVMTVYVYNMKLRNWLIDQLYVPR